MSRIEIKNVDPNGPAHGWNTKISMDGCDIGKITSAATVEVTGLGWTKVKLELTNIENVQINTNAEVEISGINIPDEIFDKILAKIVEIAKEKYRLGRAEDYLDIHTIGRPKA